MAYTQELDYLKEQFLEKSRMNIIFSSHPPEELKEIKTFSERINPLRSKISQLNSVEEFIDVMLEFQSEFEKSSAEIAKDYIQNEKDYFMLQDYADKIGIKSIDSIDEWISKQINFYKTQSLLNFFSKTTEALKNIFGIEEPSKKIIEEPLSTETIQKAQELIAKYNLSHINVSSISNNQEIISFLTKFDENATISFDSLGTKPHLLGIFSKIGISSNKTKQGFFNPGTKEISLDSSLIHKSVILHEWVHALDNYICYTSTRENSFTSNKEKQFFEDERYPITKAYSALRDLTQSLYNDNFEHLETIKKQMSFDYTTKFYSVVMGDDWYTLPQEKRDFLLTDKSIQIVKNFVIMDPIAGGYEFAKKDLLSNFSNAGVTFNSEVLTTKQEEIAFDVRSLFNDMNANLLQGKSKYLMNCELSNNICGLPMIWTTIIRDKFNKIFGIQNNETKTNFGKDYFSNACEMVARYFESQVFPEHAKISNKHLLAPVYQTEKDTKFESFKEKIIGSVFGKDSIIKNMTELREKCTEQSNDSKMKPK